MVDIRSVEPLALLDERLGPDHLLGGHDQCVAIEHFAGRRAPPPEAVDGCDAVAGGEDEVDEIGSAKSLGDPERIGKLGPIALAIERLERALDVVLAKKKVQVLGI